MEKIVKNLKPVMTAYYDPELRNWNEAIEAELKRRGLTDADLKAYCVFAIPKHSQTITDNNSPTERLADD